MEVSIEKTEMKSKREYLESYSNLAYNIAGFIALMLEGDLIVCMAFQALGVASFIYHFHKTKPIYMFDWWGIAFINTVVAGHHFNSLNAWCVLIALHVLYCYTILGETNVYLETALSALLGLAAVWYNRGFYVFAVVVLAFLIFIWVRSKDSDPKQAKAHDSIEHSLWHIGTAAGYYIAFYLEL